MSTVSKPRSHRTSRASAPPAYALDWPGAVRKSSSTTSAARATARHSYAALKVVRGSSRGGERCRTASRSPSSEQMAEMVAKARSDGAGSRMINNAGVLRDKSSPDGARRLRVRGQGPLIVRLTDQGGVGDDSRENYGRSCDRGSTGFRQLARQIARPIGLAFNSRSISSRKNIPRQHSVRSPRRGTETSSPSSVRDVRAENVAPARCLVSRPPEPTRRGRRRGRRSSSWVTMKGAVSRPTSARRGLPRSGSIRPHTTFVPQSAASKPAILGQ